MKFDKVVLCTDAPSEQGLAYYYFRAFRDILGVGQVVIVDEGNRKYDATIGERGIRRIKQEMGLLSKSKYESVLKVLSSGNNLVILFGNSDLRPKEIKLLSENPLIYLVNYLSDHPNGLYQSRQVEVIQCLPYFNLILTFATDILPVLYQYGAKRVERIPFAYCKYTHLQPVKDVSTEFPDKVFYFGTWTPDIEKWLIHLLDFNLEIEGNSWHNAKNVTLRKIATKKRPHTDSNMAIMARKAGVVVNFTRARHGCFHTMKTFELTAAGACVVSNFSSEQNEFFKDGHSMNYFNTADEMRHKVQMMLSNVSAANDIRKNAFMVALPHSYHSRCETLLGILN